MKYQGKVKESARNWAWNRIVERIPNQFHRRKARIFVLIGNSTKELEAAERKGFSQYNVIGVDKNKESVEIWRKGGGLAIQAPLEAVLAFSKVRPQGVIADFCGGLTANNYGVFSMALARTAVPGCIVVNMLRGRDEIEEFRPSLLIEAITSTNPELNNISKKRSVFILYQLFDHLCAPKIDDKEEFPIHKRIKHIVWQFEEKYGELKRKLHPQFHEYKSPDSGQWFDSFAINTFMDKGYCPDEKEFSEYDIPLVKNRLAALEAVRTKKLSKLPISKIKRYEPD